MLRYLGLQFHLLSKCLLMKQGLWFPLLVRGEKDGSSEFQASQAVNRFHWVLTICFQTEIEYIARRKWIYFFQIYHERKLIAGMFSNFLWNHTVLTFLLSNRSIEPVARLIQYFLQLLWGARSLWNLVWEQ